MKACYLDSEYRNSQEKSLTPVSCSLSVSGKIRNYWLHNDEQLQKALAKSFYALKDKWVFVSFNVLAEGRFFQAIGLDPMDFKWIDLMVMFKWFKNGNIHLDHINPNLAQALQTMCGINVDIIEKSRMQQLILDNDTYTEYQKSEILKYGESDILDLPKLLNKLLLNIQSIYGYSPDKILKIIQGHSKYVAAMCNVEREGIPLNMQYIKTFSLNFNAVKRLLINKCNEVYPHYVDGKLKYDALRRLILSKGLESIWPTTESGKCSSDDKTLKKFDYIPEINILRKTKKLIGQAGWFRPDALPDFMRKVGKDDRLRPYFNPFGTVTGRNAPPATTFIFAMSSWLRALIQPPKGYTIVEVDYHAQENAIAAIKSNDEAMWENYLAADPYFHFAKTAGTIPADVELIDGKVPPEYKKARGEAKTLYLGLQFGMGADKLANALCASAEDVPDMERARTLIKSHKDIFWKYWKWVDSLSESIEACENFVLPDGWSTQTHPDKLLTFRNFMVQGTGACIIRRATIMAIKAGLRVISNLHDSIYILQPDVTPLDKIEPARQLENIMEEASKSILKSDKLIRTKKCYHLHNEVWVDEKGQDTFNLLKEYLTSSAGDMIQEYNLMTDQFDDKGVL